MKKTANQKPLINSFKEQQKRIHNLFFSLPTIRHAPVYLSFGIHRKKR